ncbi:unnamed protein product [Pseudo-nitzschia multistriata]|uniref:Reverse transcriptase Ty1/copia-type domain-containing protein n=1 Tax=Pseudo-nitzschia multistriata TaxID=183589 RepID=A0A448ZHZ6_9STRA|nr:unnamed protein product [Pseudo-nitzschia multistriata]
MSTLRLADFAPRKSKEADWMIPDTNKPGYKKVVDEDLKATANKIYEAQIGEVAKELLRYQRDMEKMYNVVLGQIDNGLKEKIKAHDKWDTASKSKCVITLLSILRDICFQGNRTKVHPPLNFIRALRKLICTRQRTTNDCAGYVKSTIEAYEVFKSLGGSIVCPALTMHLLDDSKDISYTDYTEMSPEERSLIDIQVEQCFLAALIIEGSDTDTSTLKETLENDYCLGTKNYPTTTTKALDMLNHFKNTKKPNRSSSNKSQSNSNKHRNQKRQLSSNEAAEDSTTLVTKGETPNPAELNSRQLLLNAIARDDVFESDHFSFFQYGVLSDAQQHSNSDHSSPPVVSDPDNWMYWNAHNWSPSPDNNDDSSACSFDNRTEHSSNTSAPYTVRTASEQASPGHDMHASIPPASTELPTTVEFCTPNEDISTLTSVFLPPPPHRWRSETPQRADDYMDLIDLFDPPPHAEGQTNDAEQQQQEPRSGASHAPTIKEWNNAVNAKQTTNFKYSEPVQRLLAQHTTGAVDPAWILLDSESSINLICNKAMVKNIRVSPNARYMNIHCNSGVARTNLIAELPGFGTVWFYEKGIANVLSLALVTDRYRVTMDSAVDNALHVHRRSGHGTRRFKRSQCNLYYSDTKQDHLNVLAITTSKGIKELYSSLDLRRARKARDLQERLGLPTTEDFIRVIDNNLIKNIAVTRRDVKMMGEIYGPHAGVVKGRTVRRTPGHVREDITEAPQSILDNYSNIVLCIDIFTINGVQFLHSISRHIRARTAKAIADQKKPTLMRAVKAIIGHYISRGFKVTQIHGDNQFKCLRDDLLGMKPPIQLHCVPAGQHEPTVERSNRTVKENVRSIFTSLPIKRLPKRCLIELVYAVTFWLNCRTTGVSPTISARELLTGNVFDANEVRFQYMEYIQAHHRDTDNTMKPRADNAVYMRPTGSLAGGFFAYDVNTGQLIRRQTGVSLPMPDAVIKRLEGIAKAESMPQGLVFGYQQGLTTILDLHTEDPVGDDNDATDGSYNPADDDSHQSNQPSDESVALGFIDEARAIAESNDPIEQDHTVAELQQDETEQADTDTEHSPNSDNEEERGDEATEATAEPAPRPNLWPRVARTHNKYGADDGFEPSLHTRSFFTAGYTEAISRICEEHSMLMLVAAAIEHYNNIEATHSTKQYGVRQGIKIFGEEGVNAVLKELKQFHDRGVISMIDPKMMTREMVQQALPYLMFLKRKRDNSVKGRGCADGQRQREYINKEDATSPTVSLYALILSCLIDAIEQRNVATADIPGAFLQTEMPDDENVYIRLDRMMAELLCRVDPKLYTKYISGKGGKKVLFGRAKKAIHGTLRAALLFWEKLSGKLIDWGYKLNPYDACTANKVINQAQCTIVWHVDDLKISHRDLKVVDQVINDLNTEFGKTAPLTVTRGKIHDYVGMTIDYTREGQVTFSMFNYLEEILENLPAELDGCESATPARDHLFKVNDESPALSEKLSEQFHHYVAKLLYMAKRARPDIQTAVAFLCTRVKGPDQDDLKKLRRVMSYLKETPFLPLVLGWDQTGSIYWHVDAAFAVHKDMRSNSGG